MKVVNKLASVGLAAVLVTWGFTALASENGIYVKSVTGKVTLTFEGSVSELSAGSRVPWGAVLESKENSYAVLVTPDGSSLTLYPDTRMMVEPSLIENRPRVIISFGTVFHKVAKFFSRMVSFRTFTASSVCGVRGTAYFVEAGLDGSSLIYVTEGKVEVDGRVLTRGEALEKVWTGQGWKKRILKVRKYRPGRWFRKHQNPPRALLKALFPRGIPEGASLGKALKKALKKGKLEEGRALELRETEKKVSLLLARTDLLSHPRVRRSLSEKSLKKLSRLKANLSQVSRKFRRLPMSVRHAVEKELRLMNISRDTLRKFLSLPPEKRRELVMKLKKWKKLTPRQRRAVIRNFVRFQRLSPQQRRKIIENYKRFRKMPPAERKKVLELYKKWKSLPPEKREEIREKILRKKLHEKKMMKRHLRRNRR